MRLRESGHLKPSDFFGWRTPLKPFDDYEAWSLGLRAPTALRDGAGVEEALAADRKLVRERLERWVQRADVMEALFIASPSICQELPHWRLAPESERGARVELPLVRYAIRMATRATPFGLFAGCSTGTIGGNVTRLALPPESSYRRHTRLDMDYLCVLRDALVRDQARRGDLRFYPNSTLYRVAGQVRHVFIVRGEGSDARRYTVAALEPTDYLDATLQRAEGGATPLSLASALVSDDPDVDIEEANAYVTGLIDAQVLVSELEPAVTGRAPLNDLVSQTRNLPAFAEIHRGLADVLSTFERLDEEPLGVSTDVYGGLARALSRLPAKIEPSRLFQVDLMKPAQEATLGSGVVDELVRGVESLQRLAAPENDAAATFRSAFLMRYEQREMPLAEVLDAETGIGFDTSASAIDVAPFLAGFPAPGGGLGFSGYMLGHPSRDELLVRRLSECLRSNERVMVLTEEELARLARPEARDLPSSFVAVADVSAPSAAALASGDFWVRIHGVGGPSGANVLGRFCNADPVLEQNVRRHLRAEEAGDPDAIFAEVAHLPEGRVGNLILRPALRAYEIPYLGRSGVAPDHQIPWTDLLVSVVAGRIVLRSKALGRRVIPRATTAYNVQSSALPAYRFFKMLEGQGMRTWLRWDWGPLADAPFLPRVTLERCVLTRARWRLRRDDCASLANARGAARFAAAQELRERHGWPRWVVLGDGDQGLTIDLDNALAVDVFAQCAKRRVTMDVIELWPAPAELVAVGPEGRFHHELVVPFLRTEAAQTAPPQEPPEPHETAPTPAPSVSLVGRTFPPGSEWLYAKLYAGRATQDAILTERVSSLARDLVASGAADLWFFIRYADPQPHLRLRFHVGPNRQAGDVLRAVHDALAPLVLAGRASRLALESYEREIERYGGTIASTVLAEQAFWADSDAVLSLVVNHSGDAGLESRWLVGLLGVHRLLDDLELSLERRHRLMGKLSLAYRDRHGNATATTRWLGAKYRRESAGISKLTGGLPDASDDPLLTGATEAFARRSERLLPILAALRGIVGENGMDSLAESFLHMFVNRLMRSGANTYEHVFYDLLRRVYESKLATSRRRARA